MQHKTNSAYMDTCKRWNWVFRSPGH